MSIKTKAQLNFFWNTFQQVYCDRLQRTMGIFNNSLVHMLKVDKARQILELGCGPGNGTTTLYRALLDRENFNAKITACDLSEEMLNYARWRLPASIKFMQANSESLPFKSHSFDRVMSGMSINLVENPRKAANEIYRVCKPGGIVGISVWGRP